MREERLERYHISNLARRVIRYGASIIGSILVLSVILSFVVYYPEQQAQAAASSSKQPAHKVASNVGDWPTYLADNARTGSNSAETAITTTTVSNLKTRWKYTTGGTISTQPVEANSMVYWGSWDGNEYATDLSGNKVWSTFISTPTQRCSTSVYFGVVSTAAVSTISIDGTPTSVLFVGGKNALYALDAMTGAVIWKTILNPSSATLIWSSPFVYNGSVYVGVSSVEDCPLIQGALVQLDATTGTIGHTFYTVPNGCLGVSIWSSPTIDEASSTVYITTGNAGACSTKEIYASAIVALNASDLSVVDYWQVPKVEQINDDDFGATPTLFTATSGATMVGAVNKNGTFYAFNRASLSSGPVWRAKIGIGRINIAPAAWDGTALYIASRGTTINGTKCYGSLRAVNPDTGAFIWEYCLNKAVLAAVSVVPGVAFVASGAHVLAIATATGQTLFNYKTSSSIYGAASISNGGVYVGDTGGTLYALGL